MRRREYGRPWLAAVGGMVAVGSCFVPVTWIALPMLALGFGLVLFV